MSEDKQPKLFDVAPDWAEQWKGMPGYEHKDLESSHSVKIHFRTIEDRNAFQKLIDQPISNLTRSLWYPKAEIGRYADKRFKSENIINPKYPVYIISKGRWESRLTSKALEEIGVPYHIVVEPQEYDKYAAVIKPEKILTLPFSNLGQGSIPARNWVWEHSISIEAERHWILDDNIEGFYRYQDNLKTPVGDGIIFKAAEDFVDRYENAVISGFNYFMFVSRKSGKIAPITMNTRIYSCILIQNNIPYRWRGRYNEDTDLSIRALKDGYCTILFNAFLAGKTATMTMKGGNTDELYKDDGRLKMAQSLQEQHPDIVQITEKWGRPQHHVNYKPFAQNKLILKSGITILEEKDDYGMNLHLLDKEEVKKNKIIQQTKEPVVLKPYIPRPPIPFQPLTDDELIAFKNQTLIFDTECFSNFFLAAFKHIASQHVLLFQHPFDLDKLNWVINNYTLVGFNSLKYDLPLLAYALQGASTANLKLLSNDLIKGLYFKQAQQKYSFTIPQTNHIDLIEVCPGHGSLKLYGARLHAKRIQDVPWAAEQTLTLEQIGPTIDYCVNADLPATELVFNNLQEQLSLRTTLSKEYKQDLMSKSDAQIAEAVIGSELKRIKGRYPSKPKMKPGQIHHFVPPLNLVFQTQYMKDVLKVVETAEFKIGPDGYLERPKAVEELEIRLGTSIYRMGIGGLHSSEETVAHVANNEFELFDVDCASYYPAIILNCKLTPKHLGADFLTIYKGLVDSRLEDKKAKRLAQAESKKVLVNGTFGKTGSPHSIFYAPDVIIQILLGGQLYLLQLIEALEGAGVSVVSANTDGVLIKCPVGLKEKMGQTIKDWERATGFITEATQYKSYYARDVNCYLAVAVDDSVKAKNIYYDPWRGTNAKDRYWRFQRNPTAQICTEAVELFLTKGVGIEETIKGCQDISRFVAIKNVTGGAHWNGEYLGKVCRWYYGLGAKGTINYITSNRIVADTEGAVALMDLPDSLPKDIDYDRYIKKANEMLADMGWVAAPKN